MQISPGVATSQGLARDLHAVDNIRQTVDAAGTRGVGPNVDARVLDALHELRGCGVILQSLIHGFFDDLARGHIPGALVELDLIAGRRLAVRHGLVRLQQVGSVDLLEAVLALDLAHDPLGSPIVHPR